MKPYRFSVASWEFKIIVQQVGELINGRGKAIDEGAGTVTEYLALGSRIQAIKAEIGATNSEGLQSELGDLQKQRGALAGKVEIIIKRQIEQTLREQGIYQPWYRYIKLKVNFPPPNFKLETSPHLLVISPRNRIETMKTVLLNEELSLEAMTAIEAEVDKLDVSSLVVDLGGLATYPSLVANDTGLQSILDTAAHEWTHEYLAFTPLGFRYLLDITGLSHNQDILTMNETVADIVGKEVGVATAQKYYYEPETSTSSTAGKPAFDFDQEMRDIRKRVDEYLARGEIDTAERFMQEKRHYLQTKGYYIRKLNQAYFTFNGQYADMPAFTSPIGTKLNELRARSTSLGDFLNRVASMTSEYDLDVALRQAH